MKIRNKGQVMVEVLVVGAALAVALLLPFVNGQSVAAMLLTALVEWARAQTYLLSIL